MGEDAYETVLANARTPERVMKDTFRALHDALVAASILLEQPNIKVYYPIEDHQIAHTMVALTHRAARGVGLSTHWTNEQKLAWLAAMFLGPTDIPFAEGAEAAAVNFFEIVEEARHTDTPITAPAEYFMWADPADGTRSALAACGELVESRADDFAAAATDFTVFRNGGWIDDITV